MANHSFSFILTFYFTSFLQAVNIFVVNLIPLNTTSTREGPLGADQSFLVMNVLLS